MRTFFSTSSRPHAPRPHSLSPGSMEMANGGDKGPQDLSNFKLAENQTELRKQIVDLRKTVEAQGELVRRLVDLIERDRKGKERELDD